MDFTTAQFRPVGAEFGLRGTGEKNCGERKNRRKIKKKSKKDKEEGKTMEGK